MHRLTRALALATCGPLLAAVLVAPAAATQPRRVVWVFRYSSVTPENQQSFQRFSEIIHAKFSILAEEIQSDAEPITDIAKLSTEPFVDEDDEQVPNTFDNSELLTLWDQNGALALLLGRMRESEGQLGVRSRVFLGPLSGELPSQFVQVDLAISEDEFDSTRDSHSTIALYALGMDTVRRCGPPHEAARFFHMAYSRLPQLGAAIREADEIKTAIDTALAQMRERCPGPAP